MTGRITELEMPASIGEKAYEELLQHLVAFPDWECGHRTVTVMVTANPGDRIVVIEMAGVVCVGVRKAATLAGQPQTNKPE